MLCILSYHPSTRPSTLNRTHMLCSQCWLLFICCHFCQFSHCFHYPQHFLSLTGIIFTSLNLICPTGYSSIVSFLINAFIPLESHSLQCEHFVYILVTTCITICLIFEIYGPACFTWWVIKILRSTAISCLFLDI